MRTRSAYIAIGRDDVVEIAEPLDADTPIADYVEEHHHGLFAVWLQVDDLAGATGHLAEKKIVSCLEDGANFLSDPATTHGCALGFHHRVDPGRHPRRLVAAVSRVQSPSASAASSARNRWSSRRTEVRRHVAGEQLERPVPPVDGHPLARVEQQRPEAADRLVELAHLARSRPRASR